VPFDRKSVQSIRTMGALIDSRRTRSAAGALLELSAMANEKTLLQKELDRWLRRHKEIQSRLSELAAKEKRLMAFVQGNAPLSVAPSLQTDIDPSVSRRVKVKEFNY
jgi:hypothetical protein